MSKYKPALPFPRLELRWSKVTEHSYLCKYRLVISPPDKLDIRSNDIRKQRYGVHQIEADLGETTVTGGYGPWYGDKIDLPFRDGVHIVRDSKKLNLPMYVTFDGYACEILIDKDGRSDVQPKFAYRNRKK